MYSGYGYLFYEKDKNHLFVKVDNDFIRYYKWLIDKRFYGITGKNTFVNQELLQFPRVGAHIGIVNSSIHGWNHKWKNILRLSRKIYFNYNPEDIRIGGFSKGFVNFWMPVYSKQIDQIKVDFNIKESKSFLGLHIVIANSKNL